MKGKRQSSNAHKDRYHYDRIFVAFLLLSSISFTPLKTNAETPTTPSEAMKLFSYPKLGFQIGFPASWVVRDKIGDLEGEHLVEGRKSADTLSGLNGGKRPALSKKEQQLTDIEFLKDIRVTILVHEIEAQYVPMNLLDFINNRIQGMKMMAEIGGDDVDIKPLERVQLATVPAFVTRVTKSHKALAQISTNTTFIDFERSARRYVIDLSAPADEFDKNAAEFTRIVRSFTFIDGK